MPANDPPDRPPSDLSHLKDRTTGSHVFVGNSGYRRGPDYLAYAMILAWMPAILISGLFVLTLGSRLDSGILGSHAGSWAALTLLGIWFSVGPLAGSRRVEALIAQRFMRYRLPSPQESAKIAPAFEEVCNRAAVKPARYDLWVTDSPGMFGQALMGHSVVISKTAIRALPRSELAAVLAHEIGHVARYHSLAFSAVWWWTLPARTAGGVVLAILRLSWVVAKAFCLGAPLAFAVWASLLVAFAASPLPFCVLAVCAAGEWMTTRGAEYRADDYAARLGFAPQLAELLQRSVHPESVSGKKYFSRFPSPERRIRRLQAHLSPVPEPPHRTEPDLDELRRNPDLTRAAADIVNALQTVFLTVGPPPDTIRTNPHRTPVPSGGQQ